MPSFGEIDGQMSKMRPVMRCHKPADIEPHAPQCPAHAKDIQQQAHGDEHTKHRLHSIEERMRSVAVAEVHFVKREAVVEDQQTGENKDDQTPDQ